MAEVKLYPVPPGARVATCKSCGSRFVWGKTDSGKSVPLSIDSPHAEPSPETGDICMAPSHFTDCPQASSHSKKPTPAAPPPETGDEKKGT